MFFSHKKPRGGVEPPTSSLPMKCSNHLSYLGKKMGAGGLEPPKSKGREFYRLVQLPLCDAPKKYSSQWQDSNPQPRVYKTLALPLSYTGILSLRIPFYFPKKLIHNIINFESQDFESPQGFL